MENKYHHSKIYKIQDCVNYYYYIGSTCNCLSKRFHQHKTNSKYIKHRRIYEYFNSVNWENVNIILRRELLREEDNEIINVLKMIDA